MRLNRAEGFTLVELLMAMMIGIIVMGAALSMLARSQVAQQDVGDRVDATQRGRLATEAITRPLRSMVCLAGGATPVTAASSDSLTFYADLDRDAAFDPEQWRISAVRTGGALTGVRVDRWENVTPPVAAAATPTSSRVAITGIAARRLADGSTAPLLGYGVYAAQASAATSDLPPGTVGTDDLRRIVRFDLQYTAKPTSGRTSGDAADQQTSVFPRTVRRDVPIPVYDCGT